MEVSEILDGVLREGLYEEGGWDPNIMKSQPCKIWGQSIPDWGNSKYKGHEMESQSLVWEELKEGQKAGVH